jgi:hypothetical protein
VSPMSDQSKTTRRRFRRPLKAHLAWRAWEARNWRTWGGAHSWFNHPHQFWRLM